MANAYFSLFMAVGNVLGFATGSYNGWYKIFRFTVTSACNPDCANLKSAFFLDIAFIVITTYISISAADELTPNDISEQSSHTRNAFLWDLFGTLRALSGPIWFILLVTALTWIGWFPFLLFDTDWMGREIYGGKPNGQNYSKGVRMGCIWFDVEFSGSWNDFGSPGEAVPEVGDWCCMGDFEHPHVSLICINAHNFLRSERCE